MINSNTRIIELFIDDDYEGAGIDAISLVSRPAHDETWMAFNSQKKPLFNSEEPETISPYKIVEDNFCDNNPKLNTLGEPYSDLINDGWEIVRVEKITPQMVIKMNQERFSSPNESSELDREDTRIRFKYIGPRDEKNRQFCSDMLSKNRVYRVEDIDELTDSVANEQFGFYNIFLWRGSFNCRHQWVRLIYKKEGRIVNSGNSTKGLEDTQGLGSGLQPDTRTTSTINAKNKSNQWKPGQPRTGNFADKSNGLKDACWEGYEAIGLKDDGSPNCVPIKMEVDDNVTCNECDWEWKIVDGGNDPYVCNKCGCDNTPDISNQNNFAESISDYPESVKNSAKRAIDYAEKNGWGSCGTQVGKTRASQLAKGESISVDTIKRMYSYLSRHKVDLNSSKSYDKGCGKLMYDSWGGESALSWSEKKLKQLEKQKMVFAFNEDKKILIGAAMIPNKMIHRYDDFGNMYYVFFSKKSIKQMADKFLKEQKTDETSVEHDGIKLGKDKVFITESWVSEDPIYDKSHKYGFELPEGTWFVSMKVNDDKVWKMIKEKSLTGFSVEGLFAEKSVFSKEDKQINQLKELINQIKDYD